MTWLLALLLWQSTGTGGEAALRRALRETGAVHLPPGDYEITREIVLPPNSHDLVIDGGGATLRMAPRFVGRAAFVCLNGRKIVLRNLSIEGNRETAPHPAAPPSSEAAYSRSTPGNGVLIDESSGVRLEALQFTHIAGFAILINHSREVNIAGVHVTDSGSPAAGGVLLEEGTSAFSVTGCELTAIRGHGIWTHSLPASPRNTGGHLDGNKLVQLGGDAIRIGQAMNITVEHNAGAGIGYPSEGSGTAVPAAIRTAGNVGASTFRDNHFEEVNGTCLALDSFHDSEASGNSCANHAPPAAYPRADFAIQLRHGANVRLVGNTIEGWLRGGILVSGSGHTLRGNHLLRLNQARCGDAAHPGCVAPAGEPDLLRTGIYLRRDAAAGNHIENNEISGYGMSRRCLGTEPGATLQGNTIAGNDCTDEDDVVARR